MMDKVWKRISAKRPKGAKLVKIVGILSAMVWIAAGSAFFLLKDGKRLSGTGDLGHGGAKAESGHGESGGPAGTAADVGDHGISLASVSAEEPGHGDESGERGIGSAEAAPEASHPSAHEAESEHDSKPNEKPDSHAAAAPAGETEGDGGTDAPRYLPSREEVAALRQVVELQYAAGALQKALTPLRRVLRMPTREERLLAMATDIFLGTANYEEARGTAEQVLALNPANMPVRVQGVEAQYRMGEVDAAFTEARSALKEHPGNLAMVTLLATMEVEMGPGRKGYGTSLQAALKLKPDYAPAVYLQGRKAQLEGDYKDAEIAFRRVIKLDPRNAKAYGQLGMALYHLGKDPEAEKAYRAELDMNPEDYNTWFNLGELRMSVANKEMNPTAIQTLRADAMECYLKALEFNRDHAEAHYRVGVLLNGNGQYKEAIRHLEASLKAHSSHVPTLVQLSVAFENLKQPERARAYLNRAYELDPLNKVVLFKLKQWS
ncbi:MAG: repeat-containing protein [Fibrobacteres bacterium]|nr:repeat-containing protein [Fibrobacterota bacterium]